MKPPGELHLMANKAVEILNASLESLSQNDSEEAKAISKEDDEVDPLYEHFDILSRSWSNNLGT